jgi:hypothetical protein
VSPLELDLGVDLSVVDDPPPSTAPTATDTGFLIHSLAQVESPDTVQEIKSPAQARALYPGETALLASTDAYFGVGGSRLFFSPLGDTLDEGAAVAGFTPAMGPGQLMAPEVATAADMATLRDWAWDTNRVFIAQAPDAAAQAALETLATAVIDDAGGRNVMLEADRLIIPGTAPSATREVPASVVKAALIARSDRVTGNPNLAAAGNHTPGAAGESTYVLGIKNERSKAEQEALAQAQVNCFRTVNNRVRSYGFWTLADLDVLPQWWDMSGSRTIMALRAEEQAVAEELMFGQVAADGAFLDKYKAALSGVLSRYQRLGAIYGTEENPGYRVDVSTEVNPLTNVARGIITAVIVVKTSPFAAELKLTLTRRAITERVV